MYSLGFRVPRVTPMLLMLMSSRSLTIGWPKQAAAMYSLRHRCLWTFQRFTMQRMYDRGRGEHGESLASELPREVARLLVEESFHGSM